MKQFWADEGGAVATEYAVVVTLIALVIVAGVTIFGENLNEWFGLAGGYVDTLSEAVPE